MNPEQEPQFESPAPEVAAEAAAYPFWTYEDVALFFGMGLPCLVLSVAVMELITWISRIQLSKAPYLLGAQFIGYFLLFMSLVLLLRVRYHAPFWQSMAWTMPRRGLVIHILMGPVLAFSIAWLGYALKAPTGETPFKEMLNDRWSVMVTALFGVTIGPLCEELAFRGFLMPLLTRSFGGPAGILITALPFAMLHGPQYAWSWQHILLLLLAGSTFGVIRQWTGSTAAATMTHAAYNLTFFSALVLEGK